MTAPKHTPGAMRAAAIVLDINSLPIDPKELAETAAIIDRETAAPELLEALKACVCALEYREARDNEELAFTGNPEMPPSQALSDGRTAIAKATEGRP